jgi:hypothetical protein
MLGIETSALAIRDVSSPEERVDPARSRQPNATASMQTLLTFVRIAKLPIKVCPRAAQSAVSSIEPYVNLGISSDLPGPEILE